MSTELDIPVGTCDACGLLIMSSEATTGPDRRRHWKCPPGPRSTTPPPERDNDPVNHPAHYISEAGIESIDVIEAFGLGFHLGNAVKYILRCGRKDPTKASEDLLKARWYLDREIARRGGA